MQYFLNPHHIMKYLFSLLLLCQIIGLSAKEHVDSILSVLDSEIEHREIYYQQKEKKLEDIKQQFRYVKKTVSSGSTQHFRVWIYQTLLHLKIQTLHNT